MPRAFSSGSRSVSTPVRRAISAVLPWSMWPAVPSVSGRASAPAVIRARRARRRRRGRPPRRWDGGGGEAGLRVGERAGVEQEPPVLDAPDERRVAGAQGGGERVGAGGARVE